MVLAQDYMHREYEIRDIDEKKPVCIAQTTLPSWPA
jgi:hypothetical protein